MDTVYVVEYRSTHFDNERGQDPWSIEMIYHLKHDAEHYAAQMNDMADNDQDSDTEYRVKEYKVV